ALALEIGVPENRLAVARGQIERGPGGDLLALDDVAQMPPSSRPRVGENGLGFIHGKVAGIAAQLVGMDELRRRQARGGTLGEHAGNVVEGRNPVKAEMSPAGIDGVVNRAGKVGLFL